MNNSITLGPTGSQGRPGPVRMTNIEYRKHLRTKKILKLLEKWDLTNATSTKKQLFDSTKIKAYQN